jgi:hypothetical protein
VPVEDRPVEDPVITPPQSPDFKLVWLDTKRLECIPEVKRAQQSYEAVLDEYRVSRSRGATMRALALKIQMLRQAYHVAQMREIMILKHVAMVQCIAHIEELRLLNKEMAGFYASQAPNLNEEEVVEAREELLTAMESVQKGLAQYQKTFERLDASHLAKEPEELTAAEELELEREIAQQQGETKPKTATKPIVPPPPAEATMDLPDVPRTPRPPTRKKEAAT